MRTSLKLLALTLTTAAGVATAAPVTLGFDNAADWGHRMNDAAVTSLPAGVTFTSNAWAVGSSLSSQGCSTGFLLFVPRNGCGALMLSLDINVLSDEAPESFSLNVAQGFVDAIDFSYSTYEGLSGFGAQLTVDVLDANGHSLLSQPKSFSETPGCPSSSVKFCSWEDVSLKFSGVAHSIVFKGNSDLLLLDTIKFNNVDTSNKAPEPASIGLMAAALGAAGFARRRSKR